MGDVLAGPALDAGDLGLAVDEDGLGAGLAERRHHVGRSEGREARPHPLLADLLPQVALRLALALGGDLGGLVERLGLGRVRADRARPDQLVRQRLRERGLDRLHRLVGAEEDEPGVRALVVEVGQALGQFSGVLLDLLFAAPGVALLAPPAFFDPVLDVAADAALLVHVLGGHEVDLGRGVVEDGDGERLVLLQQLVRRADVGRVAHPRERADGLGERERPREVRRPAGVEGESPAVRRGVLVEEPADERQVLLEVLGLDGVPGHQRADVLEPGVEDRGLVVGVEVDGEEGALGAGEVGKGAERGGVEHARHMGRS